MATTLTGRSVYIHGRFASHLSRLIVARNVECQTPAFVDILKSNTKIWLPSDIDIDIDWGRRWGGGLRFGYMVL